MRHCDNCGRFFKPGSARARFCSNTCRSQAHRAGRSVAAKSTGGGLVVLPQQTDGELVVSVRRELTEAGRLATTKGQQALDLARRIEATKGATLSAFAAAHRELRATVDDALRGANQTGSAVQKHRDELAARRQARGA